jgi:polysaccharide export outer membrane protein
LVACGEPGVTQYPTAPTSNDSGGRQAPGDVIEVRVFYGAKELVREYRIGSHGEIAVPYIGRVPVTNRSQDDVEADIQQKLADGYLKDPIVSVDIKEQNSKKVTILGQVKNPGTMPYFDGMTIVEAVSQAGGFTPMAKNNSVTVTRTVDGKQVRYTVPVGAIAQSQAKNFPMRPGDAIFVPERIF